MGQRGQIPLRLLNFPSRLQKCKEFPKQYKTINLKSKFYKCMQKYPDIALMQNLSSDLKTYPHFTAVFVTSLQKQPVINVLQTKAEILLLYPCISY